MGTEQHGCPDQTRSFSARLVYQEYHEAVMSLCEVVILQARSLSAIGRGLISLGGDVPSRLQTIGAGGDYDGEGENISSLRYWDVSVRKVDPGSSTREGHCRPKG